MKSLLLYVFLVCILAGCLRFPRSSASNFSEANDVRITLWSRREEYKPNEPIEIKATIENISNQPVVLSDVDKPAFDLCCYENGDTWALRNPEQAVYHVELEPGEKIEIEMVFVPNQAGSHSFELVVTVGSKEIGFMTFSVSLGVLYAVIYNP